MIAYLLRRLLLAVPTLIGVNLLLFTLFFVISSPDDMARAQLGAKRVTTEAIERWKADRGYDKPLFWNGAASGTMRLTDTIFVQKSARMFLLDINHELRTRMWPSLAIALPVFLIGLFLAVSLALMLAFFRATWIDMSGVVICVMLMSISSLFYIIAGQYVVARVWNMVPISGFGDGIDAARFLVLPMAVGVIAGLGGNVRWYRAIFLAEKRHDPHPYRHRGGDPLPVSRQPDHRIVFRHPGTRYLHHRRDPDAGFRDRALDGVHRLDSLHPRTDPYRPLLHPGRSPGAPAMNGFQIVVLWSDALLGVLLLALGAGIVAATRREHLRRAWSAVFASRVAMASLVVLTAYVLVAVLDSFHFRPALETADAPTPGATRYSVEVLSLPMAGAKGCSHDSCSAARTLPTPRRGAPPILHSVCWVVCSAACWRGRCWCC